MSRSDHVIIHVPRSLSSNRNVFDHYCPCTGHNGVFNIMGWWCCNKSTSSSENKTKIETNHSSLVQFTFGRCILREKTMNSRDSNDHSADKTPEHYYQDFGWDFVVCVSLTHFFEPFIQRITFVLLKQWIVVKTSMLSSARKSPASTAPCGISGALTVEGTLKSLPFCSIVLFLSKMCAKMCRFNVFSSGRFNIFPLEFFFSFICTCNCPLYFIMAKRVAMYSTKSVNWLIDWLVGFFA